MDKIKRIILFLEWRFCQRDYERFGIELLQENGFKTETWEFTPFLKPQLFKKIEPPDPVRYSGHQLLFNSAQIKEKISQLDDSCFVVNMIPYKPDSLLIYKALSQSSIRYAIYVAGSSYPCAEKDIYGSLSLFAKTLKRIKRISPRAIKKYVLRKLHYQCLGIRPADLILAGAAKTNLAASPVGKTTEIIWLHYLDYDIYLREIKKSPLVSEKIAVFLDEYLPFHPDWTFCQTPSPISPEDYYPQLCSFFDYVEKKHSLRIVIAAHPRADYTKRPDYFGGRRIVRGQTAGLVRQSEFVLAHGSYSVNFAVLFRKPVIFLTSDKLRQSFMNFYIEGMAETLGKVPVDIGNGFEVNWNNELLIDAEKYRYYRNYFIKKDGTEELPFWQIVANRIKLLR